MEATRPVQTTTIIAWEVEEYQKSVGAYQKRVRPGAWRWTAVRKLAAGRMPWGPMRPLI